MSPFRSEPVLVTTLEWRVIATQTEEKREVKFKCPPQFTKHRAYPKGINIYLKEDSSITILYEVWDPQILDFVLVDYAGKQSEN